MTITKDQETAITTSYFDDNMTKHYLVNNELDYSIDMHGNLYDKHGVLQENIHY